MINNIWHTDINVLPNKEYDWGILVYYKTVEPKFLRVEEYNPNDNAGVEMWAYQRDILQLQEENLKYKQVLEKCFEIAESERGNGQLQTSDVKPTDLIMNEINNVLKKDQ